MDGLVQVTPCTAHDANANNTGSGSRPSKSQATPPPLYLTHPETVKYCHTCGRVIGSRRSNNSKANVVKYCSDKCKAKKPSTNPESLDVRLEQALLSLLLGDETNDAAAQASKASNKKRKAKKGDRRILVSISDLENAVFGDRHDPEKVYGRNKNRYRRGVADEPDWKSVDMQNGVDKNGSAERLKGAEHGGHVEAPPHDEEDDSSDVSVEEQKLIGDEGVPLPADHIRPSQHQSAVNFSVGGERGWGERIDETPEMLQRRREGQQRADEKELAKNVARRAVVFGLEVPATRSKGVEEGKVDRRYCEVILKGGTDAVEPSFAKGDWTVRWREESAVGL